MCHSCSVWTTVGQGQKFCFRLTGNGGFASNFLYMSTVHTTPVETGGWRITGHVWACECVPKSVMVPAKTGDPSVDLICCFVQLVLAEVQSRKWRGDLCPTLGSAGHTVQPSQASALSSIYKKVTSWTGWLLKGPSAFILGGILIT